MISFTPDKSALSSLGKTCEPVISKICVLRYQTLHQRGVKNILNWHDLLMSP